MNVPVGLAPALSATTVTVAIMVLGWTLQK